MKKTLKMISFLICFALVFPFLTACSKSLDYNGTALVAGKVGVAYEQSVAAATGAEGITYTLKTPGSLPAGLTLTGGKVSGTPTAVTDGAKVFTVVAKATGFENVEAEFSITVAPADLTYVGSTLTPAIEGEEYSASVKTAVGFNSPAISYSLKTGNVLPDGLSFTNGDISGTPTTVAAPISFTVVAEAVNHANAEAVFTLEIVNQTTLAYIGATLENGEVGTAYSQSVASASGFGDPVITYTIKSGSNLPAGLDLSSDGMITGIPTAAANAATFVVVASAQDFTSAEATFTLTIEEQAVETYIYSVALADLDDMRGGILEYGGYKYGEELLEKTGDGMTTGHISGYFLEQIYRNSVGHKIVWVIVSDSAVKATLKMSLGAGGFPDQTNIMNSGEDGGGHIITVNEVPLEGYNDITLARGAEGSPIAFNLFLIGEFQLVEGENYIEFTFGDNAWLGPPPDAASGPMIECIVIETVAGLTWTPRESNLINRFPEDY